MASACLVWPGGIRVGTVTARAGRANVKAMPMPTAPEISQRSRIAPLICSPASVPAMIRDAHWVVISTRQVPRRCVHLPA